MRLLILSEAIYWAQHSEQTCYTPPYDVRLDVGHLDDMDFAYSIFDYGVSIIHIEEQRYNTSGHYQNLPKLLQDSKIALEHGRSIICLPQCKNFTSYSSMGERGMEAYEWLKDLGVELQDNLGENILPSAAGRAQIIQDYLKYAPKYHQIVKERKPGQEKILAVVADTKVVVGLEYKAVKGALVILPPPIVNSDQYYMMMSCLVAVAQRYYERAERHIPITDAPEWVDDYLALRAREL
jgi:hypothetical protein